MADVILFRPKISETTLTGLKPQLPMGLLCIAAPLVEAGYKVKIIDEQIRPFWSDELDKELNDSTICVGISSMTGSPILGGLEFAKVVKNRFDIPIVWGGLHPSMLPEQTLQNDLVDIIVKGEGEEAFLKIVNALKSGDDPENIPNVGFKRNGRIKFYPPNKFVDLNTLSLLPYHLVDCESYIKIERGQFSNCRRIFVLHTDRGCPHKCGFCYNTNINNSKWRYLRAPQVVDQIEYLLKNFSLDGIEFLSDNFFVNKKRVTEICKEIIKKKIKFSWHADCRIDYFAKYDDSFIDLLEESGCVSLTFGIESGSPKILDLIRKDINLDDVFIVNKKIKKRKISVGYHFMAGFPGETKEDILETYKIMLKLYSEYPDAIFLGPSLYTPYPGTFLYDKCLERGFKPPRNLEDWARFDWYTNPCLPFAELDYSKKWLTRSANIARRGSIHGKGLSYIGWWYRVRMRLIIKFKIIGPQPEEMLVSWIRFIKMMVISTKKLLKIN